eukprot:TRINITY_DN2668_c0_g3_i2.p1 TRINITY_DN2668_c0_g3~~TRINITY_DN2668_c0_g3_i2.p1  ORF type:complete len:142 (+),score=16.50 TRINITY_DN2668_c0_g3_i2:152-577(+)
MIPQTNPQINQATHPISLPLATADPGPKHRSPHVPKLIELDKRYSLIRPHMRVLEVGCYPGGWTQHLVSKVGSTESNPLVTSVDVKEMAQVPGSRFVHGDVTSEWVYESVERALDYQKVDLVPMALSIRFAQTHVPKWTSK